MRGRRSTGIALAFAALGGCTRGEPKPPADSVTAGASAAPPPPSAVAPARHPIARPAEATADFAVLTDRPAAELDKLIAPASLAALLAPRHCGPPSACDAVRALASSASVEVTREATADWGLPPEGTLDLVASALSPAERASVRARPSVVHVRAHGAADARHLVARAAFALTAALAEKTAGLVYDETERRIEPARAFAARAIVSPLGDPALREACITIQMYDEPDGTARLVSLGMARFGAPDVDLRGASPSAARALGAVINAVAARLAAGATEAPLAIDVNGARATVDLVVPPREAGDPDNALVRVVPLEPGAPGTGATPAAYDALAKRLFGAAEPLVDPTGDRALAAASARAARTFPAALARWKSSPAPRPMLLVKLPFPLPGDAGTEQMWVLVTSADGDALAGTLANDPAYATDLKNGAPVKGRRKDLADWLIKLPDGGTEGGETIKLLEGRK